MGCEIYVKRDDGIGPGLGGNKTRKLEYLLADARQRGARKVVTFGGLQSNHARLTAAAARRCGLEPHLFYFARRPAKLEGNLLVNRLVGAHMHFIPFGGGGDGSMTLEAAIRLVRWIAWARVGPHYFIPVGGHSYMGCLGYVQAAVEIDRQARSSGIENAHLIVAAGTGGTLAGLLAGLTLIQSPLKLLGLDIGKLWKLFPASVARLAGDLCAHLGSPHRFSPQEVPLVESRYCGPGYARPWDRCQAAMETIAVQEGLLLDPIYTGKAFTGMLDLIEKGEIRTGEAVIFLHTGGLPALFASDHG
jgi:1-aminocyclopropane-1-carboxylate deaminase/D-cysteine desulfhydrase-like pyridoxal-dependent ACC family enzyme